MPDRERTANFLKFIFLYGFVFHVTCSFLLKKPCRKLTKFNPFQANKKSADIFKLRSDKYLSGTFVNQAYRSISFGHLKFLLIFVFVVKGTVSKISRNPPCKDCNARFTTVPLKP